MGEKSCRMCLSTSKIKAYLLLNKNAKLKAKFEKCFKVHVFVKEKESYICEDCEKKLDGFLDLQHRVKRNEEAYFSKLRQKCLCEHCGKIFQRASTLMTHRRSHYPNKIFHCDLCDQTFFFKKRLQYHIEAKHCDEFKYPCQLCPKKFKTYKSLRKHCTYTYHASNISNSTRKS